MTSRDRREGILAVQIRSKYSGRFPKKIRETPGKSGSFITSL